MEASLGLSYEEYERNYAPIIIQENGLDAQLAANHKTIAIDRWLAFSWTGSALGHFVTGKWTEAEVVERISAIPDILKHLSPVRENVDMLSYSANFGAFNAAEIPKILENPHFSCLAMGIEMASFRCAETRLTTRALDSGGRAYTEQGNKVSHSEEAGKPYFTQVPGGDIRRRLSRFIKYQVSSPVNHLGPQFFARYLNCVNLHLRNLHVKEETSKQAALMETFSCYAPLVVAGLKTVRTDQDSFEITDDIAKATISPDNFEISGNVGELPGDQQQGWHFLKEILMMEYVRLGKFSSEQAVAQYPELAANIYTQERFRRFIDGPDVTLAKTQNTTSTGKVEHLGDNRDIPKLTERRRINGFGLVRPPPETNSSISTVGRRGPTFAIQGRTYRFQFMGGKLAFEVTGDDNESKTKTKLKTFTKKNRIKLKFGFAEVDRVTETQGSCESLSDLVEYYIHNSDNVEGRIWLLAALRSGAEVSEDSSCIFDAVSRPKSEGQFVVTSAVKCDVLEAVDVFVSSDENDERIFLDYSGKSGIMLGIWGTGGMKSASGVKVERSKLLRARIDLAYDVRHNSYISNRS